MYHRILPIIDVEVLPARHFVPTEDGSGLVEVPGPDLPGRSKNWIVAETLSKIPTGARLTGGPREFTAREFRGTEGDEKLEMVEDESGNEFPRKTTTWVHPPELEQGGRVTGQTVPIHID